MKRFAEFQFFCFCLLLILINSTKVQSDQLAQKENLFDSVDEILLQATKAKADFFSPQRFAEGLECYNDAKKKIITNKNSIEIEELIKKAISEFNTAVNHAQMAADFFSTTIIAREDTLRVEGSTLNIEKWNEAEELFQKAAESLEDGDDQYAKKKSIESEALYREIELYAIQSKYLKETWLLLEKAEKLNVEKYAPITLQKGRTFADKAALMLRNSRYDQTEAAQLAGNAEYEVSHAIYLTEKIKKIMDSNITMENVFLSLEDSLQNIASIINMNLQFNKGVEQAAKDVTQAVETLQQNSRVLSQKLEEEKKQYFRSLSQKDTEIYNSQNTILKLNEQVNQLSSTKNKLQSKVDQEQIRQKKLNRIGLLFNPSEAKILLDGDSVIIRLLGLSFPIGKAIIEPQYYQMLSKTIDAINEFPGCSVTIEGHTDSRGNDDTNQKLSEERAKAVKEYIISNSNISEDRVQDIGYGETRPIASNDNADGQTMNRRIDLIIKPK